MEKFFGVFINTGTVLVGSLLGSLLKKGIPERVSHAIMLAIGLCTLYIGIDGALEGGNPIVLIVSLVVGTLIGTLLNIDGGISRMSTFIEKKVGRNKQHAGASIAEGFMTGSLLFCVGAMTIVGSLKAGLDGDNQLLYTKSILDLISSCVLASSLGAGVVLAAAFVLVYQGGLVLLAGLLGQVLTDPLMVAEITCVGSVIIMGLGLNLLGVTKIKVANMLPAILLVPPVYWGVSFLPL